jgi:hypothetical protein
LRLRPLSACQAADFALFGGNQSAAGAFSSRQLAEEDAMRALRSGLISIAILLGLGFGLASAQQGENLASPQQKAQQEKAQQTKAGQAGTTEPSSHAPTAMPDESVVLWNGRLTVPGAPADSQTVPAKYSERNDALDRLPTMAFPLPLTDEQRARIRATVGKTPAASASARPAELLPSGIDVRQLPRELTAEIPATRNLGYVRTADRILLVSPPSRIVMGEIAAQGASK